MIYYLSRVAFATLQH